jgi:hypothetical protein
MKDIYSWKLRDAPLPWKALAAGYLLALAAAYAYALANVALVVGLSTDQIAIHYYGAKEKIPAATAPKGEQALDLDSEAAAPAPAISQPSLKKFVAEGHFHLFGMTSFFFGLTFLGLFTGVRDKWKAALVSVPYLTVIVDNASFIATRFLGPRFALLTAGAGSLMALSFSALWLLVFIEIIRPSESRNRTETEALQC